MNVKAKVAGSFFSKRMWLGFIIMAGTWLSNNTEMLINLVPAQYSDLCGYGIGIAIWIIGWVTTQPLEDKVPKSKRTHPPATDYVKKEPTISKKRWDEELQMSNELDEF